MTKEKCRFCFQDAAWDETIECTAAEGCGDRYHYACEGLTKEAVSRIQKFACRNCTVAGIAQTTYQAVISQGDRCATGYGTAAITGAKAGKAAAATLVGNQKVDGPLDFLRDDPQFKKLRRLLKQHPTELKLCFRVVAIVNPKLFQKIKQTAEQFSQPLTEKIDTNVKAEPAQPKINGKAVPKDPDLSVYKQIADKLNTSPELLAGYDNADKMGDAFHANLATGVNAEIKPRVATIVGRQRAIYAQMGLMKVMGLDAADIATVRENSEAVKDFMGTHLSGLVDVQNADVTELIGELHRLVMVSPGAKVSVNMWNLFGWGQPGSTEP